MLARPAAKIEGKLVERETSTWIPIIQFDMNKMLMEVIRHIKKV